MDFLALAQEQQPYVVSQRRFLHAHPEACNQEYETTRHIRAQLDAASIPYLTGGERITVAVIEGALPGRTSGLRCDIDALQLEELTGLPYASMAPGLMHACGHDAHTAMGLGAARILHAHRSGLCGTVKVIFQPAEEGGMGADQVIEAGVVSDVQLFLGIHVKSQLPTGWIEVSEGPVNASSDFFTLALEGQGGHGAYPHLCVDALSAACAVVQSLQTVVSRAINPMEPAVLTVGSLRAGTRANIIAQQAVLEGTFRAFQPEVRRQLQESILHIATGVAQAHRCQVSRFEVTPAGDAVINDPEATAVARSSALRVFGPERVKPSEPSMGGDDISSYRRIAPTCYAQLGVGNPLKGAVYPLHHNKFDLDEDALALGVAYLAAFGFEAGSV